MQDIQALLSKVTQAKRELATCQGRLLSAQEALALKQQECLRDYEASDSATLKQMLAKREADFDRHVGEVAQSIRDLKV